MKLIEGMDRIEFTLNQPTPLQNQIKGMNRFAYQKLRKSLAWEVGVALFELGWRASMGPMDKAAITVLRYSNGQPDWDGLYGGLKPLLDCLIMYHSKVAPQGLGVIRDDRPKHLVQLVAEPRHAPPRKGFTRVTIEAVHDKLLETL